MTIPLFSSPLPIGDGADSFRKVGSDTRTPLQFYPGLCDVPSQGGTGMGNPYCPPCTPANPPITEADRLACMMSGGKVDPGIAKVDTPRFSAPMSLGDIDQSQYATPIGGGGGPVFPPKKNRPLLVWDCIVGVVPGGKANPLCPRGSPSNP